MASTLKFKSLEARNFMSIGNTPQFLELDGHDSVLVEGRNMDVPGSRNGCGKTVLINAICYALFNKPFNNISLQRLINSTNASKNTLMEVKVTFDKDGHEYEIYRARGEDYKIEVKRDGEDITPGKGVYETDEIIIGIIGISYEMFTKTVIFSGASEPFLELPIAKQRQQIEELFNISLLSEKAGVLKETIKDTETDIKVAEALVVQQQASIAQYKKQVADAEKRIVKWDNQRETDIANIKETLADLASVDIDEQQNLHKQKADLQVEITKLTSTTNAANKEIKASTKQLEKLMNDHEHLSDAKCPYCSQQFADAPEKIKVLDADIAQLEDTIITLDTSVSAESETLSELKKTLAAINKKITHSDLSDLIEARTNKTVLEQKIIDLQNAENPHTEVLEKLLESGEPTIDNSRVDMLRKLLDHQTFLLKLLTDKNSFLRRRIINKTVPILNARLNHYTTAMGLPHVAKFDSDMTCTVTEFGRELDFGNLSMGEKKRVNTSMSLAFRDVIHQLHSKINLLLVDEIDGSLDTIGIESVIRVLKNKSRDEEISMFVISHHPSVSGQLDRTLVVQKENGFSSIFFE